MNAQHAETSDQELEQLTALFRLLADRTRLQILMILTHGEQNVSSLCEQLQLPQPTVSHHLALLRMSQVIGNRRAGKQVFYGLNGRVDTQSALMLIEANQFDVSINRRGDVRTV